jgi:hypothetical protein
VKAPRSLAVPLGDRATLLGSAQCSGISARATELQNSTSGRMMFVEASAVILADFDGVILPSVELWKFLHWGSAPFPHAVDVAVVHSLQRVGGREKTWRT